MEVFDMNSNRMTYVYSKLNTNMSIDKKLKSLNLNDYICDYDLYSHKIESLKGFSFPFVQETYEALKNRTVIPILLRDPVNANIKNNIAQDIPSYMFNFTTFNNGKFMSAINMDLRGGYKRSKIGGSNVGAPQFLDIDDRSFFHLSSLGYVINRLFEMDRNGTLKSSEDFPKQIAAFYAILMGKCLDRTFPMANMESLDLLYFLCACFCLESMFEYPKETAVKIAKKIKFIRSDNTLTSSCGYLNNDNISMTTNCDYVNRFPLDNFTEILMSEFTTFRSSRFKKELILQYFVSVYGINSMMAVESIIGLITMIVMSRAKLKIYNDFVIDKNMELIKNEFNRVFNQYLSKH